MGMGWLGTLKHGHFSDRDAGLNDPDGTRLDRRLMELLDEARDEAGTPFIATSGYRPAAQNAAAGGASDSAHLPNDQGLAHAVDGYFAGWPLLEQFELLKTYPFFGVGAYPFPPPGRDPATPWTPVVHGDRKERGKPFNRKVLWIRNRAGLYVYWPSADFMAEFRALARLKEAA